MVKLKSCEVRGEPNKNNIEKSRSFQTIEKQKNISPQPSGFLKRQKSKIFLRKNYVGKNYFIFVSNEKQKPLQQKKNIHQAATNLESKPVEPKKNLSKKISLNLKDFTTIQSETHNTKRKKFGQKITQKKFNRSTYHELNLLENLKKT